MMRCATSTSCSTLVRVLLRMLKYYNSKDVLYYLVFINTNVILTMTCLSFFLFFFVTALSLGMNHGGTPLE